LLRSLGDSVKVETPFDVEKFELLLVDHLNKPFVQSVMKGLQEGFWPFNKGEWKVELEEVSPNYDSDLKMLKPYVLSKIGRSQLDDGRILWLVLSCFQA
jgi:hypothetical protein